MMGTVACVSFLFVLLAFSARDTHGSIPVTPLMRSFSSAIKGGSYNANEEKTFYERNTGTLGVITEQWFTG